MPANRVGEPDKRDIFSPSAAAEQPMRRGLREGRLVSPLLARCAWYTLPWWATNPYYGAIMSLVRGVMRCSSGGCPNRTTMAVSRDLERAERKSAGGHNEEQSLTTIASRFWVH
jgi:hypothetical protein